MKPSSGQLCGDAGRLPICQFDQRIGLTRDFADALKDPRDPDLIEHTFLQIVQSRVYGILAGYEDQNDHDSCVLADRAGCDASFQFSTSSRNG
jgi:hypothetical protein